MIEKLKDVILDGRWQYVHRKDTLYVFKNIYNGEEITLSLQQTKKVLNGEETISHIQCRRLGRDKRPNSPNWWNNHVITGFAKLVQKHNK